MCCLYILICLILRSAFRVNLIIIKRFHFKTTNAELGLVYLFSANEQVKLFYQLAKTEQITVDKASLIARRALPVNADIASKSFGVEGSVQRVDYKLNPRKGFQCKINTSLSIRNFIKMRR